MRKITEYTKVQLDRSSLNNFDTIIAKFDPKKIEAAITLVLGRQGLYESYYYSALMDQIIDKLRQHNISIDDRLLSDIYSDLPDYEDIKDIVNSKYGEEIVDTIVDKIGEEAKEPKEETKEYIKEADSDSSDNDKSR